MDAETAVQLQLYCLIVFDCKTRRGVWGALHYIYNLTIIDIQFRSPQQNPMSVYDFAIGQPHNPAYIGNLMTKYRQA